MADQRPDDHNVAGLTHDLPCVACGHGHGYLACEWCPCGLAPRNGIYP